MVNLCFFVRQQEIPEADRSERKLTEASGS